MTPKIIHASSDAIAKIGKAFSIFAFISLIAGIIWAASTSDDPSLGIALAISAVPLFFLGLLISNAAPIVRAAETYLYKEDDHPEGSRDEIQKKQERLDKEGDAKPYRPGDRV